MQAIDTTAIQRFAIPRLLLMEHAGLAVARAVADLCPPTAGPVLLACGAGFNGGDGLCAGRHLHAWGYPVRALVVGGAGLRDEPAQYARMLEALGVERRDVRRPEELGAVAPWIAEAAAIVDALLGIGLHGPVREPTASLIAQLNASGHPLVSVDVPSGLDADTGTVQGAAVRARRTVTFGRLKQGCVRGEGPAYCGKLIVDPITIPPQVLEPDT